ncbi:uncharacterized protein YjbI with pentapeptide repeats [Nocardiopsis arvandica]|uniref:Uncharacterized protein YjbI with pentapeptide repeats n=1 Tax=Nocardiopsis sinuspersici TaxID=501010 RepID=A0A7Z0BH89_9ACTN|nr:pentapeptide repeat-containing protein [Nocardiopsis sinuspersici]NYH51378.1 uncharacterized protein YjbI with pentapeptide repeats [Nocardiopsis sinuspersici]
MTENGKHPRSNWRNRFLEHIGKLHLPSWSAFAVGGIGMSVALWPLVVTAWDLLGISTSLAWRLVALGICTLLLSAGMLGMRWKRTAPLRLFWLILAAWAVALIAVAAFIILAWLMLGTPGWKPPTDLTPRSMDAIATRAFAIVAGLGGVALLVISYRRQRTTENNEQREVARLFTERFTSASEQLGSESAAVRLAGVHALAHLADDTPEDHEELLQMVIDVLCSYLRMPYTPAPGPLPKNAKLDRREDHRQRDLEFTSMREVRHTIIAIIRNHLREDTRWRGKDFNFTGVVFDGGGFREAEFTGGKLAFRKAIFIESGGDFIDAKFSGACVDFVGSSCIDSQMNFFGCEFSSGRVDFHAASFTGSRVDFRWTEFSGGRVNFIRNLFYKCTLDFEKSSLTREEPTFSEVDFSGSEINFSNPNGECPKGLLESIHRGSAKTVNLPESWRNSN